MRPGERVALSDGRVGVIRGFQTEPGDWRRRWPSRTFALVLVAGELVYVPVEKLKREER